ncbi:MAG: hypothetical protein A3B29_05290 [Candidatus Sungbacteria bacterium RIFCSPLOWO2_01_FULL_51_34]|nr:MAG: hypothetical protein A3B29_05290 [Candidatus Sungbacteria bacterium RIFCSPLOWO2_01_FULL_51_34]
MNPASEFQKLRAKTLFHSQYYPSLFIIIRGKFYSDPISGQDPNIVQAQLAGKMGQYFSAILGSYPEKRPSERLLYQAFFIYSFFVVHTDGRLPHHRASVIPINCIYLWPFPEAMLKDRKTPKNAYPLRYMQFIKCSK